MKRTIEHYGDPHLHYNRYPGPGRYCNGCGNQNAKPANSIYDTKYAHIPRAINPASQAADEYKECCGKGPRIGCVNPKYTCMKNGVPYDSNANLIISPYSMPYDTSGDCQHAVCKRGRLSCTNR